MDRFSLIILVILLISGLITLALHLLFKKNKYLKYLPSALYLPIAVYNFYLSRQPSEGFQDIASFLVAIIFLAALAGNILTGLIYEALRKK